MTDQSKGRYFRVPEGKETKIRILDHEPLGEDVVARNLGGVPVEHSFPQSHGDGEPARPLSAPAWPTDACSACDAGIPKGTRATIIEGEHKGKTVLLSPSLVERILEKVTEAEATKPWADLAKTVEDGIRKSEMMIFSTGRRHGKTVMLQDIAERLRVVKEADQGFIVGAAAMNKGGKPGDVPTFVPPGPTKLEKGHTYCAYNQGNTITPQMKRVTIVHLNDQDVYYRIAGETEVKQTPIERFREIIGDKPREAT